MIAPSDPCAPLFEGASTLIDILRWRARHQPDRVFLTWLADGERPDTELTFGQLDARVGAVARTLAAAASPGDRALLLYPQGPDFLVAFLACLASGVVAVPAYPPRNARHMPRIERILADCDARVVLSVGDAKNRISTFLSGTANSGGRPTTPLLCTDEGETAGRLAWTPPTVARESIAFLQYTSGSTGDPKGVVVSHANILANMRMIRDTFGYDDTSDFVTWLPAYHDMGLVGNLLQPLYLGSRVVLMSPAAYLQKPVRWLRAISTYRARTTGAPNFAFDLTARAVSDEQKAGLDLSCLDLIYNGSEPIDARALDRFAAAFASCGLRREALYPCYGMAETTLLATGSRPGHGAKTIDADGRVLVGCGYSVQGQDLRIVDPDTSREVAGEGLGEIWLRGPHVAQGYWQRPALTREAFGGRMVDDDGDPFLRTGDLGFLREGELFVAGRIKDLVIVRGRNYYPQDIERAAADSHASLVPGSAAAFSVPGDDGGERLVVVQEVQRTALRALDAQAVFAAVNEAVAEELDLRLTDIVLVSPLNLSKTSSGKIQRRACRERWQAGDLDVLASWSASPTDVGSGSPIDVGSGSSRIDVASGSSRISIRQFIRAAVAAELHRAPDAVDPRATFASHGLDSLSLVRLSGALSEWLGRDLSPTLLYDFPTIDALAAHLSRAAPASASVRADTSHEPIAIVGIGCRLPGGVRDADGFWQLLLDGVDAIAPVPRDRWAAGAGGGGDAAASGRFGGFIGEIDRFDPQFFGIAPREAAAMDPQHRLLLEVSWQALEHAGIAPASLGGSSAGVFVGVSTHDYAELARAAGVADMYTGVGNAFSAASGRLSYVLGVHGPSLAVDTACSSSLVAVHLAVQSLRAGECDMALAGGVNAILTPDVTTGFAKAGMMAPDGRCKAFDSAADGYVRSEGCGVVVLKRLSDAVAAGDRVVAVIRGSAINQDGRSNGLTAPSGPAQEQVIGAALRDAGVEGAAIDYVEAHGTGTSLGDPIEVRALAAALGAGRTEPLVVGSVKTNLGHLEAAAGVVSLIKAAMAVERGEIPASLHCTSPNPYIPWATLPVVVATARTAFPASAGLRHAGVSSFGFTGTNAHVVVGQAPAHAESTAVDRPMHLLTVSGSDDDALAQLVRRYREALDGELADEAIGDVCHTANAGRNHFDRRIAVVAPDAARMSAALAAATPSIVDASQPPTVAWMFTGQGSQYIGMGRELYETEPVFRAALDRCEAIVRELRGESLLAVVLAEPAPAGTASAPPSTIDRTEWTQPAIFAVEYALAALWQSWGITPAVVLGHSVGEFTAATVAGVFTLEDGLRVVVERGRLMQSLPDGGGMLAVFAPEQIVADAAGGEPLVGIAATNALDETVLSGDALALDRIAAHLKAGGVKSRRLKVSHAFHSPLMAPIADAFAQAVSAVRLSPASLPIISNLTGCAAGPEISTVAYWKAHVTAPVRFVESVATLASFHITHVVEIGPAPVLTALALRTWKASPIAWLPSLRARAGDERQMLESLATLYQAGASVDWRAVDEGFSRARVTIPGYPFKRERCWLPAAVTASAVGATHPVLGGRLPEVATMPGVVVWQLDEAAWSGALWRESQIGGVRSPSFAVYPFLAEAAARETLGARAHLARLAFTGIHDVASDRITGVQVVVSPAADEAADCRIFVRTTDAPEWTLVARADAVRDPELRTGSAVPTRSLDFGVMFFNGSEESVGHDHYRLVLEAARYADRHGFSSVWAPERHYTAFGGLYPNPAVLHAALARETRHLRLMAGSWVAPLHHPLRAAEDWALVDNLSNGRVGVSLASGWNPDDFAVAPEAYDGRRDEVFAHLETLRRLWRGETMAATSGDGRAIEVRTYPTPVQREFPAWITAAGSRATFERAGTSGAHLLTHLLDQGVEELAGKIAAYRSARARAGHDPHSGRVSVMVHTFIGDDLDLVREQVRAPYCEYIKANIGLLKGLAYSRGSEIDIAALSPRDLDEFVGFLYERFYATRALIGTPESCAALARTLRDAGVDELACLIDFGPPTSDVLRSLPQLNRLKTLLQPDATVAVAGRAPRRIDLSAVRQRCTQEMSGRSFYQRLAARGVAFGESLQSMARFERRDGEALASFAPGHPVVARDAVALDAGMQAFMAALPSTAFVDAADGVYVPHEAAGFVVHAPDTTVARAYARLEYRNDRYVGDVLLLDADGRVVAAIDGLVATRVAVARVVSADRTSTWTYQIQWDEKPLSERRSVPSGRWLILADTGGVGERLADALDASVVTLVHAADLDATDAHAIRDAVERDAAAGGLAGVVNLWPLDAGSAETVDAAGIERGEALGVAATLHVAQALAGLETTASEPRLWVVTRNAQTAGETGAPALAQAPVWGLGRVIAVEHPEVWGGLIDLPSNELADRSAVIVYGELASVDGEDQVAWRGERRLVPRLVPAAAAASLPVVEPDATYLITGGLGSLGRRVAHWLVRHGARDLVLTGLHALPPEGEWDRLPADADPRVRERVAGVRSLQGQGATVTVIQADAASRRDMAAVFDTIARGEKPLRGIIHLAGRPENQPLADARFDRDRAIMSPKTTGAWLLHELSADAPLDFFVAFSSISAAWGSRGQPLYAAANHFLDALSAYRRSMGRPGLTVSWGPWAEGGMVDREGLELLARMGISPLDPTDATAVLGHLLASDAAHRVVADVDWSVFKDLFEARRRRPLFDAIDASGADGAPSRAAATALRQQLEALPADERRRHIADHVHREVAAVLGWPTPDGPDRRRGFFEMGMDSLTALELKNRLQASFGLPLKATVIFNHSTVVSLAEHLDSRLVPAAAESLDEMSEDELARLLDEQIGAVDSAGD